jgi:hypothetical protein
VIYNHQKVFNVTIFLRKKRKLGKIESFEFKSFLGIENIELNVSIFTCFSSLPFKKKNEESRSLLNSEEEDKIPLQF